MEGASIGCSYIVDGAADRPVAVTAHAATSFLRGRPRGRLRAITAP